MNINVTCMCTDTNAQTHSMPTQARGTQYICLGANKDTQSFQNTSVADSVLFLQTNAPTPSARPISQIHNWPSIMPEFICMVPAEVFTRCLWVSLTWLGCRSANLLGWSSGCSSIIGWIRENLWNWWSHWRNAGVCIRTVRGARKHCLSLQNVKVYMQCISVTTNLSWLKTWA